MDYSTFEHAALQVAASTTGLVSLCGSAVILGLIICDWNGKFVQIKYRFLFTLSIGDIVSSLVYMAWNLPAPSDTPNLWGAMGNDTTCGIQGFLYQSSLISMFYNGALAHFFYKSVCHGYNDESYYNDGWEHFWHILAMGFPCISGLVSVAMGTMNFGSIGCWFAPSPPNCLTEEDVECERGESAFILAWASVGAPCIVIVSLITFYMWKINKEVTAVVKVAHEQQQQERQKRIKSKAAKDASMQQRLASGRRLGMDGSIIRSKSAMAPSTTDGNDHQAQAAAAEQQQTPADQSTASGVVDRVQEVATQAYWYVGIFMLTHAPSFIPVNLFMLGYKVPFWATLLYVLTWPLQGFGNVLVFLRPRIALLRRKYPHLTYARAVVSAIFNYETLVATTFSENPRSCSKESRMALQEDPEPSKDKSKRRISQATSNVRTTSRGSWGESSSDNSNSDNSSTTDRA